MHHDSPAASPLLGYVTGLAFGVSLTNPRCAIAGAIAVAILIGSRRSVRARAIVVALVACACGIAMSLRVTRIRDAEQRTFASFESERFVTIDAPIDHGWSTHDGSSYGLRAREFAADGHPFEQAVIISARFEPPPIGLASRIVVRGFLRHDERGFYGVTVKSPLLLAYRGELHPLSPARWNRMLTARVEPLAHDYPVEVALVEALALGRGERLDDDVRDAFKRGGTYHLLVFSGLQIALAAAALAWMLRALHAPRASDWLLLVFALLAPPFIGPAASVSRASAGIGLYAFSRIIKRPTSFENLWCVAALTQLVITPAALTDAAFHLTYAGAGAMLFMAKPLLRYRALAAPIAAELAIVPLTLFHFHQYAIGGSLATALMTPLVLAMLITSVAACAFPCAAWMKAMSALHAACTVINSVGSHTSGFFAAPYVVALTVTALAGMVAIATLDGRRRAAALAIVLLLPLSSALMRDVMGRRIGEVQIVMLDIGQGDSIVVRSRDQVMLIDGGGRNDAPRFGETTLLPLLVDRGIRHIDVVALTHAHPDHCGGIPAVLERLKVGSMWITPRRFTGVCAASVLQATINSRTPIHIVRDGDRHSFGAFHATALIAPERYRRAAENNCSLVMRLQMGARRLLMTGDIERETEGALLGRKLRSDILKIAHHGSRSSSTPAFLDAVTPHAALISAGRHNLFGHPHEEVLAELRRRRVSLWRTDRNGCITIDLHDRLFFVTPEIDTPR